MTNPFLPDLLNQDAPSLICTPGDAPRLVELIRREMAESLKVWVASAFYSPGVINLLISGFTRFTDNGGDLRVLTSTMGNFNRPDYLVHLRDTVPGAIVFPSRSLGTRGGGGASTHAFPGGAWERTGDEPPPGYSCDSCDSWLRRIFVAKLMGNVTMKGL